MVSALNQGWYYVKITLKSKEDGTTTKVFNLSNRPLIDEADGATVYYPILKGISSIGTDSGDYVPQPINGKIVLDDAAHSIGFERKFTDYLERWQLIGGTVQIYSAKTTLQDTSITADFTLDWTTYITGAQKQGDDFSISVSEVGLPQNVLTRIIDNTTFTTAPGSSIGKYAPIVFGTNVTVNGIRTTADGSDPTFVYATTLADDFVNGGIQSYYTQDNLGAYIQVISASAVGTAVFTAGSSGGVSSANAATAIPKAYPFKLATETSYNYLITQIDVLFKGNNVADTADGTLKVDIYDSTQIQWNGSSVNKPNNKIGSAEVAARDYDSSFDGVPDFYITFTLNKPVALNSSKQYFIALSFDRNSGHQAYFYDRLSASDAGDTWTMPSASGGWYYISTGTYRLTTMKAYGVKFTDTTSPASTYWDSGGLGVSYVALTQKTAVTGYTNPDLSSLNYIFKINGILDDSSGTVSGVVSGQITDPISAVLIASLVWNGTTWTRTGSTMNSTVLASTSYYPRLVKGFSNERITAAQLMLLICKSTAMKIVRSNLSASYQFSIWAWGGYGATAYIGGTSYSKALITDEDSKLLSVNYLGTETIVNSADIQYNRSLLNFDPVKNFNNSNIYSNSTRYDYYSGGWPTTFTNVSKTIFGTRQLRDASFDFLSGDSTSYLEAVGRFILSTYAHPHVYVQLEVPMFKYKGLGPTNIVEICHPSLPAYFGSSSNAKLPYYSTGTTDVLQGNYWKRFQRYRAIIESLVFNYNLGEFPTMRLNCRLLINPDDPT